MLEYYNEQFGAVAHDIFGFRSMELKSKEFANLLEPLIDELKGEKLYTAKMDTFLVTAHNDGTSSAERVKADNANPIWLDNLLGNSDKVAMVSNRETGDSLCLAPVEINGVKYYHIFKPEEAQTLREQMTEVLNEKLGPIKEPSRYDRFCNWCAETFLKRPGKAVAEYKTRKAFSDSMKKLIDNIADIPKKVEEFKQSSEEQKRQEAERLKEQELERQRQREIEKENQRKAQEEAIRKAQEENQRKIEEDRQRQMDQLRQEKEAQFAKYQPEHDKAAAEAEKKINEVRLNTVRELHRSLPKKIKERDSLVTQQENLKKEIAEGEKNLNTVKEDLDKKERWLKTTEKELDESRKTLKDLKHDLQVWEKLKALQPQKIEQQRNLTAANEAIPALKEQIKLADVDYKKAADEYHAVAGAGHIYIMKPEQYLQYIYDQAKAGREQILQQERAGLAAQMKAIEDQIEVRNTSKAQIQSEAKAWDYLPLIRGFRQKAQFMDKEDALKADLEKQYKALKKEDEETVKAFEAREAQHKKLALDFSPEKLKETEEFLKAGLADTKAKHEAFKAAGERVEKLKEHLAYSRGDRSQATKELERLNQESGGKDYDESLHTRTQNLHDQLADQITSLTKQCTSMKTDVSKSSQLVRNAEFELQQKKDELPKLETRYRNLDNEIDRGKSQLYNFTSQLHKAGIAVEPSPEMQQVQQPKQPQAQPQHKPAVKSGPM